MKEIIRKNWLKIADNILYVAIGLAIYYYDTHHFPNHDFIISAFISICFGFFIWNITRFTLIIMVVFFAISWIFLKSQSYIYEIDDTGKPRARNLK